MRLLAQKIIEKYIFVNEMKKNLGGIKNSKADFFVLSES